jgi:hypothetical protein
LEKNLAMCGGRGRFSLISVVTLKGWMHWVSISHSGLMPVDRTVRECDRTPRHPSRLRHPVGSSVARGEVGSSYGLAHGSQRASFALIDLRVSQLESVLSSETPTRGRQTMQLHLWVDSVFRSSSSHGTTCSWICRPLRGLWGTEPNQAIPSDLFTPSR